MPAFVLEIKGGRVEDLAQTRQFSVLRAFLVVANQRTMQAPFLVVLLDAYALSVPP